jgi:hypothetical protein
MMKTAGLLLCVLLPGLTGCQCCCLFEPYASLVDCISDHEHHFERYYSSGWDLNRIGREDWCQYPEHRFWCPCACARCRPAPCEYLVCQPTGRVFPPHPMAPPPGWSEEAEEPAPLPSDGDPATPPEPEKAMIPPTPSGAPGEITTPELP